MKMPSILEVVDNRFVLFPIRYNSIWQMYKKAVSSFWTTEEIDLSSDMSDWEKLNINEQFFLKNILAFFAGSDGIVNENLAERFIKEVPVQEVKCFYGFQIAMENIHCVSPDTEILTSKGYNPIATLEGKVVEVWNGLEWSKVMVMKTSDSSKAHCVTLSNGMHLICTPNHEWLIKDKENRIETKNLVVGSTLQQWEYPVLDVQDDQFFNNVTKHGLNAMENHSNTYSPILYNCRPQCFVPTNYSIRLKLEWLSGVFSSKNVYFEDCNVVLKHKHFIMLSNIQLLLTTLNVHSKLDKIGQLMIDYSQIKKLVDLGLDLELPSFEPSTTNTNVTIEQVYELNYKIPMYCFEEPLRHTGCFNGILTGQSETYSLLLDTYIKDSKEKHHLLNAINTIPCIAKKAEWSMKWISDKESSFAKRLVAFACVEGIFFSGAFCSIFWVKERGLLPGLCLSNEFISRDESLHTEFAILLYSHLEDQRLSQDIIFEIIKEAVEIEDEFINESIPCNMLGMNSDLMSQYIKFVADRLCSQLGYEKIYNVGNPFPFMDRISLSNKSNFFEHTRISEYSKARVGETDQSENKFALDAEF